MSLGKALFHRSARPGLYRRIALRSSNPAPAPSEANPSSAQLASDRDDVFKVFPERKTVETVVGDLPLSPVMDPTFWEARQRHQLPKVKAGKPQNSVERQLRANPFANALATPVRMCALTRTRLPNFFLQEFSIVSHPETGDPWFLPHSLIPDEPAAAADAAAENTDDRGIEEAMQEAESEEMRESAENTESEQLDSPEAQNPTCEVLTGDARPHGPAVYVLARQDLLSSFTVRGSGYHQAAKRIAGASPRFRRLANKVVWRKDMDTYILGLLRQDVVNELLYLSKLCVENGRYYIVKCYGWDDVKYKHKGSVLWFGEPEESAGAGQSHDQPGPFAVFDIQGETPKGDAANYSVAVHNIPMLLGPEQARRVVEEAGALKDGSIFMLAGRRTAKLELKLWRLQGYLSDYL